jgi:hypothetical protein
MVNDIFPNNKTTMYNLISILNRSGHSESVKPKEIMIILIKIPHDHWSPRELPRDRTDCSKLFNLAHVQQRIEVVAVTATDDITM